MSEKNNATDFIQSSNKAREYENKKSKNKINPGEYPHDYEYEMATTKLISDWIASCPVNFVNVKVPINDEVQLTLSRTRKE